ncbi:MAG: hypothetical protein JSV38_00140, partial [Desulfobacterales bacterium]
MFDQTRDLEDMNVLLRKIAACLIVVIIGIHFGFASAGEADPCVGELCLFCNGMPITHGQPFHPGDSTGPVCPSPSVSIPCNLKKNLNLNEHVFIVSSAKEERQKM